MILDIILDMLLLVLISILLSQVTLKLIPPMLIEGRSLAKNYQGRTIPVGYGMVFALNVIAILMIGSLLGYYRIITVYPLMILILAMAFVGLLDDTIGSKDSQGFSGHFKRLIVEKRLTTGAIKAIFSLLIVLFINFYLGNNIVVIFIDTLLILLMANFINLLDLRPGRALKMSLFLLIIIFVIGSRVRVLAIPIITIVAWTLPFDLRAEGMMGDVGANVLGGIIGFLVIIAFGLTFKLIILLALLAVHIYAEFYSLSRLIKRNKLLLYVDRLGRQ
ncbi:glycosyl transferase family 4 [Halonatronum saccharophilum]|uniref:glycosyl transferase family 4 n=1 Tax=Halonatronum saccharophilum TaxID=150060 RepID=UPI0004B3FC67|nr:glycosyl transferase family 4 [Halonatronum saccharophilum]